MNTTVGTTNAVMFSVSLLSFRDVHLNFRPFRLPPRLRHHDMDAPPWWNVSKRTHLYVDGFAPKGARPLMQFTLVPDNGPEQLKAWEPDFEDILAHLESLEPPAWPYEVDATLAAEGRRVFDRTCASCHGTYGERETYPNRRVSIDLVGTDRLRLDAITRGQRRTYAESWFTGYDPKGVVLEPGGYVAPPLDGIWASAPYLHNGSVPTLRHLLHPDERPSLWKRSRNGYDRRRVGLEIVTAEALPASAAEPAERRRWFDASLPGKSAGGHRFPDVLTDAEKRAVLEYLKTL
jgi:mono/diheme cytochrome c family protein